jgi:UDP-galactopyranose mutase
MRSDNPEGRMRHFQGIITFSHLRWNFVYQRPQHLFSRLASRYRVLFIEEPLYDDSGRPAWERETPAPNVTVCRPRTPVRSPGFHREQLPYLQPLLDELIKEERLGEYVAWLYTPMAAPLLAALKPAATVYDCMDELAAFLEAPPELLAHEAALLESADLVFTGGRSLYRAKKDRHPNVHCFPSSVDAAHFSRARNRLHEAQEQAPLPHPRLGFFGVIDERIDLDLLQSTALARPEWSLVLVGPVVKIDPRLLPRLPNIHYFGQRSYQVLPEYLAGWDICLLPFALNEATRFISPTKTLEYMAAEKPIVSTPITDVAEPYGDIVYLGASPAGFLSACGQALRAAAPERRRRLEKARAVLARTSWDATATAMEDQIVTVLARRKRSIAARLAPAGKARPKSAPVVVLGAGPTGLSAAYHLGSEALLVEQNGQAGGWCRSFEERGFTFDFAGHIMFSQDPYVHGLYRMLLGNNVHWQDREAWIFSKGVYTRYPFQGALYGLPPAVIKECLVGAIEARFGSIREKIGAAAVNGGLKPNGACRTGSVGDCCADGILEASAPLANSRGEAPRNFEEFIYRVWGAGIAKHFAIPYNRKLWTVPLSEMETSWLGGRVPLPDLEEMIEGALHPAPKPMGPNARFGYPLRGGFQALMNGFLPHLKAEMWLRAPVVSVSPSRRVVTLADRREIHYEYLVSTMPLPLLVRCMGEEAPPAVRAAAARLRSVSVRCVHLGIGRENLTGKHWIYYPEDTIFHRIFVQGNASPHCNAPGGFALTCEITHSPQKPLPCEGGDLIAQCIADCRRVGMFQKEDPVWVARQVDLPHAYVVYDHGRAANVAAIANWLSGQDILLAGRYGQWEYYNSDHAFISGRKAAEQVRQSRRQGALRGAAAAAGLQFAA